MRVLEASENKSQIHRAIAELPATQRQIITLFYLRDYSQKEIEQFLELPVSMIKKALVYGSKKTQGEVGDYDGDANSSWSPIANGRVCE